MGKRSSFHIDGATRIMTAKQGSCLREAERCNPAEAQRLGRSEGDLGDPVEKARPLSQAPALLLIHKQWGATEGAGAGVALSCVWGTLTWPKSKGVTPRWGDKRKSPQMNHLSATAVMMLPGREMKGSSGPKRKVLKRTAWELLKGGPAPQLAGPIVPSGGDVGPLISLLFSFLPKTLLASGW